MSIISSEDTPKTGLKNQYCLKGATLESIQLCSNTRTSLSTLNLSTLSVLTEYAEYAVSVFQIEYQK